MHPSFVRFHSGQTDRGLAAQSHDRGGIELTRLRETPSFTYSSKDYTQGPYSIAGLLC